MLAELEFYEKLTQANQECMLRRMRISEVIWGVATIIHLYTSTDKPLYIAMFIHTILTIIQQCTDIMMYGNYPFPMYKYNRDRDATKPNKGQIDFYRKIAFTITRMNFTNDELCRTWTSIFTPTERHMYENLVPSDHMIRNASILAESIYRRILTTVRSDGKVPNSIGLPPSLLESSISENEIYWIPISKCIFLSLQHRLRYTLECEGLTFFLVKPSPEFPIGIHWE